MVGCEFYQSHFTARADSQLSGWRAWLVRRHLQSCDACRLEAVATERQVRVQTELLRRAVEIPGIDVDGMRRRLRTAIAAESIETSSSWGWDNLLRPAMATVAILVISFSVMSWQVGPVDMLEALGFVSPPAAVANEADLFHDYVIIEKLDALENFDSVNSVSLEDQDRVSTTTTEWIG